jgi:hypothetical protein
MRGISDQTAKLMDFKLRIVTELPLKELWKDDGSACTRRIRYLTANDITELLRNSPVEFVIADVGQPLRWILPEKCYEFWKTDVRLHLASPENRVSLDDFPDAYCYFASEWESQVGTTKVIALEKTH